jgi:hypothetical protein
MLQALLRREGSVFHVSEQANIREFVPRPSPRNDVLGEWVWAIDAAHLHNYLLPRDCPRVTFYALPSSDRADIQRLLGVSSAKYVMAIEQAWFERVRRGRVYVYELPITQFSLQDSGAGYYVSRQSVVPSAMHQVNDILAALLSIDLELRIVPSLWPLHDAVAASSLQFSMIRMRNAQARYGMA